MIIKCKNNISFVGRFKDIVVDFSFGEHILPSGLNEVLRWGVSFQVIRDVTGIFGGKRLFGFFVPVYWRKKHHGTTT